MVVPLESFGEIDLIIDSKWRMGTATNNLFSIFYL